MSRAGVRPSHRRRARCPPVVHRRARSAQVGGDLAGRTSRCSTRCAVRQHRHRQLRQGPRGHCLARPDTTTFELLPWAKADEPSGRMFCNIKALMTPRSGDSRQILQRNLAAAQEKEYTFFAAPEAEFFYFESGETEVVLQADRSRLVFRSHDRRCVERSAQDRFTCLRRWAPVEYSFHETRRPTRDRSPLYRGSWHGGQHQRFGRREEDRPGCGVCATFMPNPQWRAGLRHAHAPVAFRGRDQRLPRRRR